MILRLDGGLSLNSGMTRTVVLLGAGASRDAGLPLTNELAARMVDYANSEYVTRDVREALNFVYGAMVAHHSEAGGNPREAVNIETLISAVRLLADRERHEVAPFVATWKQGASGFVRRERSAMHFEREVVRGVNEAVSDKSGYGHGRGSGLARTIEQIAENVVSAPSSKVFRDLEALLLTRISAELTVLRSVDYLFPLADLALTQQGGLDIVSLNYDRAVERMADERGVALETGIERWQPGHPLIFESADSTINLIKMHGSLGWKLKSGGDALVTPPSISVDAEEKRLPWIVVGDREKLATDGPTLELVRAAELALARASNLVVVGYSFSDAHMNAMIRNWMSADPTRTITVVDPGWPNLHDQADARVSLARAYGDTTWPRVSPGDVRMVVIAKSAGEGLAQALVVRPERVESLFQFRVGWVAGLPTVTISCNASFELLRVSIHGFGYINVGSFVRPPGVFLTVAERAQNLANTGLPVDTSSVSVSPVIKDEQFELFPEMVDGDADIMLTLTVHDRVTERSEHIRIGRNQPGEKVEQ